MKRPRLTVIRLYGGGYLTATGGDTYDLSKALIFHDDDARRFRYAERRPRYDQSDVLWGASLEMLPKRTRQQPITSETYQLALVGMQRTRLAKEIARLQAAADGYAMQARLMQEQADVCRQKIHALQGVPR